MCRDFAYKIRNNWVEDALLLSTKNIADSKVDYHDNTTTEIFEVWFTTKLLTKFLDYLFK